MRWIPSRESLDRFNEKVFGVKRLRGFQYIYPLYWIASAAAGIYWLFWVRPENKRIREEKEQDQ